MQQKPAFGALRRGLIRLVCAGFAASLASCAYQYSTVLMGNIESLAECSVSPASDVVLNVSALPIALPPDIAAKGANPTRGVVARRITVMFAPTSAREMKSLAWGRLTLRVYGGTLDGWTRVRSDGVAIEVVRPADAKTSANKMDARELAMIDIAPGKLTVTRSAASRSALSNAITVDVLLLPGGVPIDEPLVRIPALWNADGKPLPPNDVSIQLEPTRHVPGYDQIESEVVLDYASAGRSADAACRGSARTRVVLVDKDGVRPPLWDLGLSTTNAPRVQWLGLRGSGSGAFRAVFDSPTAATSFANWIRATRSTQVGSYQIGLFARGGPKPIRPLVPVDRGVTDEFAPITPDEAVWLRVGALGEP